MAVTIDGTNGIDSPDLNITGTGARITGDFSSALANRVAFQSSTTNGNTNIPLFPNGTAIQTGIVLNNADSSTVDRSTFSMLCNGLTDATLRAGIIGVGTYLPMTFHTGGSERVRLDTSGNLLVTSPAGLGYGTGAGGTVTQATSKSTAVTLNKPTGKITMNNAALLANASVYFICQNSLVTANDTVIVQVDGTSTVNWQTYAVRSNVNTNQFAVKVTNETGGSLSEAIVINFAIIKGASA